MKGEQVMRVYVLSYCVFMQSCRLVGVFTSWEKAVEAAHRVFVKRVEELKTYTRVVGRLVRKFCTEGGNGIWRVPVEEAPTGGVVIEWLEIRELETDRVYHL